MVYITPEVDLLIIAFAIVIIFNLISRAVRNKVLGKGHMEEIKKKQAEFKELIKKTDKKSQERLKELEHELLEMNLKMMKASFPTMLLSLAVIALVWPFLQAEYGTYSFPLVGSWIWYYIVVSLVLSIIISRIFK